ncbi:MAG: hypothetical protein ACOC16_01645 [Nanoarchaeota archaeon]
MAGFDKSLDKELFSKEVQIDGTKITVGVFSYNENTPKLQISRKNFNTNADDYIFAKLGRLTKEEAEKILPIMQDAIKNM